MNLELEGSVAFITGASKGIGRECARVLAEEGCTVVVTARGKGLHMRLTVWRHAFRNALIPGLNSMALSTAMLFTGAFIVEIIFGYPGVSALIGRATQRTWPDLNLAMGFAVYSILMVLPVMFILDILRAVVDPRLREGSGES